MPNEIFIILMVVSSTGDPRLRAPSFKVVIALEFFFCNRGSDFVLGVTLKDQDWNDKEAIA